MTELSDEQKELIRKIKYLITANEDLRQCLNCLDNELLFRGRPYGYVFSRIARMRNKKMLDYWFLFAGILFCVLFICAMFPRL